LDDFHKLLGKASAKNAPAFPSSHNADNFDPYALKKSGASRHNILLTPTFDMAHPALDLPQSIFSIP
jgi:hypothetical protein